MNHCQDLKDLYNYLFFNDTSPTRYVHLDAGALVCYDLGGDGVPAGVLHVSVEVEGLHHGHSLEVADGRLQGCSAHAGERVACLENSEHV